MNDPSYLYLQSVKAVIIFLLLVVIPAAGQIKVSGHIVNALTQEPLHGVNILVKGRVIGTVSNTEGNFELMVNLNAFVLQFSYMNYHSRMVKVSDDHQIKVQLMPMADLSAPFWKMQRKDSALFIKKSVSGMVYTYAVSKLPLNTSGVSNASIGWTNANFSILAPLDSLLRHLEVCYGNDTDYYRKLNRIRSAKGEKPVLLTKRMLERIGMNCLTDFAIRMIQSHSLSIRNDQGIFVDAITVSDVFWKGTCATCCWGGYIFTIGEDGPQLFSRTHTIC